MNKPVSRSFIPRLKQTLAKTSTVSKTRNMYFLTIYSEYIGRQYINKTKVLHNLIRFQVPLIRDLLRTAK